MKIGQVYEQGTVAGARVNKGTKIDIYVSTGAPKVTVPDVMGKSNNDAIAALADAKLKFKVLQVFSKEDAGTVVAQSPTGGRIVNQGSIVHINVSKGLQPLQVPDVRGQLFDNAAGQLQGAGFAVARQRRRLGAAEGHRDRPGSARRRVALARRDGHALRLEGPEAGDDPRRDEPGRGLRHGRCSSSRASRVDVQVQDTTDPAQDGIVLSQDPLGGTKAKPGTTVTIFVGQLVAVP